MDSSRVRKNVEDKTGMFTIQWRGKQIGASAGSHEAELVSAWITVAPYGPL